MNAPAAIQNKAASSRVARAKAAVEMLLAPAGIGVDGSGPFDIHVLNDAFYTEALPRGVLGICEAYVDGWWEADQLDVVVSKVLTSHIRIAGEDKLSLLWANLKAFLLNQQNRRRSLRVASQHYDLGNDLFYAMLDKHMVYSCAYWKDAQTLEEAQEAKLDLVCRKLALRPGIHVLDIGCGWGSFAKFATENYGVSVVGINISEQQLRLGREMCAGLPVELKFLDYRDLSGSFDAVVSIGMFEHVGYKNYRRFMQIARNCLKPGGIFLLHTIGSNISGRRANPWVAKYIFPNGMTPSARQIAAAAEGCFVIEDWHNFGADYDRTLMAWFRNFDAHWPALRQRYGERFYRMWKCYLHFSAGSFRARANQLWQLVLSPEGTPGGHVSIR